MRRAYPLIGLLLLTGCPPGPYSKAYQGSSDTERKLFAEARRDVLGLIRFRGRQMKGGYDGSDGDGIEEANTA